MYEPAQERSVAKPAIESRQKAYNFGRCDMRNDSRSTTKMRPSIGNEAIRPLSPVKLCFRGAIVECIMQEKHREEDNGCFQPVAPPKLYGPRCRSGYEAAECRTYDYASEEGKIEDCQTFSTLVQEVHVDNGVGPQRRSCAAEKAAKQSRHHKCNILTRLRHRC